MIQGKKGWGLAMLVFLDRYTSISKSYLLAENSATIHFTECLYFD